MSTFKRVQTDDIRASNVASNTPSTLSHGLSPDLTNALRNVGMRTRKSVLEGYATNPVGTASRMKAMSTGTLSFQSSPDPMVDIRAAPSVSLISPRKRHRSASPTETRTDDDATESMSTDGTRHPERPVKPLKSSQRLFQQSQSLPAGSLLPSQSQSFDQDHPRKLNEEEDDWSSELTFEGSSGIATNFEPMSLA
ncbi:hypothetical protein GYMLUDRAFT_239831 [Collybiopsis luxurians FD-317 M1]|nr:hypothetical protein GYMLUDRAFT_239831 [Collybiopsis luxurians FD-317 M1]